MSKTYKELQQESCDHNYIQTDLFTATCTLCGHEVPIEHFIDLPEEEETSD